MRGDELRISWVLEETTRALLRRVYTVPGLIAHKEGGSRKKEESKGKPRGPT